MADSGNEIRSQLNSPTLGELALLTNHIKKTSNVKRMGTLCALFLKGKLFCAHHDTDFILILFVGLDVSFYVFLALFLRFSFASVVQWLDSVRSVITY